MTPDFSSLLMVSKTISPYTALRATFRTLHPGSSSSYGELTPQTQLVYPIETTLKTKPKTKTKRPIDTPTQKDRISQEALRGILECVYEPLFREFETKNKFKCTNFGFRPGKSTRDALYYLKRFGTGTTYVMGGDISGAYNKTTISSWKS